MEKKTHFAEQGSFAEHITHAVRSLTEQEHLVNLEVIPDFLIKSLIYKAETNLVLNSVGEFISLSTLHHLSSVDRPSTSISAWTGGGAVGGKAVRKSIILEGEVRK